MIETVKKDLVLEYVKDTQADQLLAEFVLSGFPDGQNTISLLESVGMMIKYVKREAEKTVKGVIKDVVLVVPNHWNIHQRKFLTQAAELAELYVLSLIHENTAAAINYALSQRTTNES
jgi:hypoxia up-regulated 1